MARTTAGVKAKRQTIGVNGLARPSAVSNACTIRVDGIERVWAGFGDSHNAATYLAAIDAMMTADAAGVTHLTLRTPNDDVRRTATGEWECRSPDMAYARALYMLFRFDFDDVDWARGSA